MKRVDIEDAVRSDAVVVIRREIGDDDMTSMVECLAVSGVGSYLMGEPAHPQTQFKCAHCEGISAWRFQDKPLHKCVHCGAPRME